MRGLSWPPSGPLTPGDALEAVRVDARRWFRPPPLAAAHHPGLLTPLLAAATAARGRAAPRAGSTHGRSAPRPWPVCRGATAWPTPCRGWAQAVAEAVGRWHEANRSYHRPDTISAAAV